MKTKKSKIKKQKTRDYNLLAHIQRAGAGAGFHSKRGYCRKVKHKKQYQEE
tara:strand:- start:1377 stop:1529 length:153 start_codon:yes stop_codon:yes gene_type:complete